jgi:hypothetical protein
MVLFRHFVVGAVPKHVVVAPGVVVDQTVEPVLLCPQSLFYPLQYNRSETC